MKPAAWAALAIVALAGGGVHAQDVKERTLTFAHQNSREHPQGLGVAKFAELVAQKSGGKMKVEQLAGGVKGDDLATVSAVQAGSLDMVVLNTGLLASVAREAALVDLPFLFDTAAEADAVMDGPFGRMLNGRIGERNLVGLAYWDLGFRDITNSKRPINRMEDIAGLKLRVLQSPAVIDSFTALGAIPTPVPFPEVYQSLEKKRVDGQENPVTVIADSRFDKVQKYLALTNHVYNPQSVLISRRTWDGMSAAERKIVQEAAAEATAYQRKVSRERASAALTELRKSGMTVTELPPGEIARMREKLKPVVEKYSKQAGEAAAKELAAEIAKARK